MPIDGDVIGGEAAATPRRQRPDLIGSELEPFLHHTTSAA
jgi:hypothetical protein